MRLEEAKPTGDKRNDLEGAQPGWELAGLKIEKCPGGGRAGSLSNEPN